MSGTTISSASLDPRRRKILFRCWHRGTKEMDLVLGKFVDRELVGLNDNELADLEVLMEYPDRDLFSWISGEVEPPQEVQTGVYNKIITFHQKTGT
ncbi:MAG: succinate dehydrogenase assembly factor 2 [Hyphomicrobiales bacterium]|nr:succinate dehydrogenase assembly factor 2 [Hyphomicrobiales bacterium]